MSEQSGVAKAQTNSVGLTRLDYRGAQSTLCQGCGHNAIAAQIVAACFELGLLPEQVLKFSGIGCSSKSPTYFLGRSFGFNGLHGRMPSLALGALFADRKMRGIGVSGDGDTVSIGLGQFKHLIRRNMPMVYIIENNGVYGLTKGQFSATAEQNLQLKKQGINPFYPIDICIEALASNASFVARSFAGDPKQVKELIKAAFSHQGIAILDIISPCVTFHNLAETLHSYGWGRDHETPLHDLTYIPPREEINIEQFEEGTVREVCLYDGSRLVFKKLAKDYDPTSRQQAFQVLEESQRENLLITGLIFIDPTRPSIYDFYDLPEEALNRLSSDRLRPSLETLDEINAMF